MIDYSIRRGVKGPPDLSGVRNVLVIALRNIGDVVLTSPVFAALEERFPSASLDALVNSGTEEALMGNPAIRRIHVFDRKAGKGGLAARAREEARLLRAVRSSSYDMAVALTTGNRALNLAYLSGARIRVGVKPKRSHFPYVRFLTHPVEMASSGRHYVERYLDVLKGVGIAVDESKAKTSFYEGEEATREARELLASAGIEGGAPYIVVHPTSRWMFKCWPAEKTAELIDRIRVELKTPVVLTSAPGGAEEAYVKRVLALVRTDVVDLSGRLTLRRLGALIRGARLFFGVDSAPMHIAAAVGTRAVALFGPTSETDWGPWGDGHAVITSDKFGHCRPCGKDGCNGSKVSDCLTAIEVTTVFEAIKPRLAPAPVSAIYK